jgi:hypothetical protein
MGLRKRFREWCPQPESPTPTNLRNQNVNLLNIGGFYGKVTLALRLVYGLALIALLFTPFAFYFSRAEPYIMGNIWGFQLPMGYVGLVLGLLVIFLPKTAAGKLGFGTLMVIAGVSLFASAFLCPYEYFINLIHGTNFYGAALDIEYPIGHIATVYLALFSIIIGLAAKISGGFSKKKQAKI